MKVKPVLRWAGGKRWFQKHLESYVPHTFKNYFELFSGGLSVFQHLSVSNKLTNKVYLSDVNSELINFYRILKDCPNKLELLLNVYSNNEEEYYRVRQNIPNCKLERAARFLYLNRTSFNGIYRENLKGVYNVPYGHKQYKRLFDIDQLYKFSFLLRNVSLYDEDFEFFDFIEKGDFVFLDPPYTVAHNNNGFVKYNHRIFKWEDQVRLQKFLIKVDKKGGKFMMTNAAHTSIRDLYKDFDISDVSRASLIGGKNATRGRYKEIVVKNY